jgi:uncharacterized protein (DUF952 family)
MARYQHVINGKPMTLIYILCTKEHYEQAVLEGTYRPESLALEGFIHASPAEQLTRVANKYYREHLALCVMSIAVERIHSELRWETIANGDVYPHIYGPLNMDAVQAVQTVTRQADGMYTIDLDPAHA